MIARSHTQVIHRITGACAAWGGEGGYRAAAAYAKLPSCPPMHKERTSRRAHALRHEVPVRQYKAKAGWASV